SSSLIILPPPRPPPFPYTTLFRSADRASIPPPVVSDRLAHDWGTWPGAAGASHAGLAGARTSDCSDEAAATATGMQPTPSRAEEGDEWPPLHPPVELLSGVSDDDSETGRTS